MKTFKTNKEIYIISFILFSIYFIPNVNDKNYSGIILVYFLFFILLLKNRNLPLLNKNLFKIVFLYTLYTIFIDLYSIIVFSKEISAILRVFIYNSIPLITIVVGIYLNKYISINNFIKVTIIFFSIQGFIGFLQIINENFRIISLTLFSNFDKYNYTFEAWEVGRAVGTLGNPNAFGTILALNLILIIHLIVEKNREKSFSLPLMIVFFTCTSAGLILSQSRTSLVVLIIGLVIYFIFTNLSKKIKLLIILFPIIVIFYLFTPEFLIRRLESDNTASLGGRIQIWNWLIQSQFKNMGLKVLAGEGVFFFRSLKSSIDNYYLQLVLQYGLWGLFNYILIFFYIIYNTLKSTKYLELKPLLISITSILLFSDFVGTINMSHMIIIWYFLFVVILLYGKHHTQVNSNSMNG